MVESYNVSDSNMAELDHNAKNRWVVIYLGECIYIFSGFKFTQILL